MNNGRRVHNAIVLDIDFKWNKSEREKAAKLVENGELKPKVSPTPSLIHSPKKYEHLWSGGGEIAVEKSSNGYSILYLPGNVG